MPKKNKSLVVDNLKMCFCSTPETEVKRVGNTSAFNKTGKCSKCGGRIVGDLGLSKLVKELRKNFNHPMGKGKILEGWIEKDIYARWKKGYPFKLWQEAEKEEGDIKVHIIITELKERKKR